jgi:hypothetical protein
MSTPASTTNPVAAAPTATAGGASDHLPSPKTMLQAAKIAIEQDRAIMLDYFHQTHHGTAFLGEDPATKERVLVKATKDEFTSLIKKLYKSEDDFIILTENSLYIVSGKIQKRKVNLASLQEASEL